MAAEASVCGSAAPSLDERALQPGQMGLFAGDDVLIGVVEIVVADDAGGSLVTLQQREPLAGEIGQELLQVVLLHGVYAFCVRLSVSLCS